MPAVAGDTCAKELFRIVPCAAPAGPLLFPLYIWRQLWPSKNMSKGFRKVCLRPFLWTSNLKLFKMTTKASLSNWILWRSLNKSIFGASPHLAWRVAFSTIVLPISHMSPPGQAGRRRDVRRSISTGVCRLDGTASQTRTCSRRCSCLVLGA